MRNPFKKYGHRKTRYDQLKEFDQQVKIDNFMNYIFDKCIENAQNSQARLIDNRKLLLQNKKIKDGKK